MRKYSYRRYILKNIIFEFHPFKTFLREWNREPKLSRSLTDGMIRLDETSLIHSLCTVFINNCDEWVKKPIDIKWKFWIKKVKKNRHQFQRFFLSNEITFSDKFGWHIFATSTFFFWNRFPIKFILPNDRERAEQSVKSKYLCVTYLNGSNNSSHRKETSL